METLAEKSHRLTVQRFGKTIQLYAPLYLSNECIDTCLYCGFSRHNRIERLTLDVPEVLEEAQCLIHRGFQHILLVAGEHPKKVSVDYLCAIAQVLRPKVSLLGIEVSPFQQEDYRRLFQTGIDWVVVYQETYNREIYKSVHKAGPKSDFEKRLRFIEEACRAGVRHAGIGVLLGLADWREEIGQLIHHAKYLMKHYWRTQFSISLPRLKSCASDFKALKPVSDEELEQIIITLRIALPEVGLVLSTRERPSLRDRLMKLGITHMSAGSRTEPGGYSKPDQAGKQFELEDSRTPAEVANMIQRAGYEPVWKDWI